MAHCSGLDRGHVGLQNYCFRVNMAAAFYWKLFDGMHLASSITTGPCIGVFVQRRKAQRIAVCHRGRHNKYDYISSWSSSSSRKRWKLWGNCTESLRWRMLLRSLMNRWEPCHSLCNFFIWVKETSIQMLKCATMCEKTGSFDRLNPISKHLTTFMAHILATHKKTDILRSGWL